MSNCCFLPWAAINLHHLIISENVYSRQQSVVNGIWWNEEKRGILSWNWVGPQEETAAGEGLVTNKERGRCGCQKEGEAEDTEERKNGGKMFLRRYRNWSPWYERKYGGRTLSFPRPSLISWDHRSESPFPGTLSGHTIFQTFLLLSACHVLVSQRLFCHASHQLKRKVS